MVYRFSLRDFFFYVLVYFALIATWAYFNIIDTQNPSNVGFVYQQF
jgi:hypothetical protein